MYTIPEKIDEQPIVPKASPEQTVLPFFSNSTKGKVSGILGLSESEKNEVTNFIHKLLLEVDIDKLEGFKILSDQILSSWDLKLTCSKGWTLLMYAAESNCFSIVKLLAENGTNTSLKNIKGNSALKIAKHAHNYQIADFLIDFSK